MSWDVEWLDEAKKDLRRLDDAARDQVIRGVMRVSSNPLPQSEGGYGKPLRNDSRTKLAGLCKVKFRELGIRVIYKAVRRDDVMLIIVVGVRSDSKAYEDAAKRRAKYDI